MKKIIVLFVLLSLAGCAKVTENTPVDEYISESAEFSLTFPASYELSTSSDSSSDGVEVTAHCVRSGEGITLSVVSPERSKDVGIKLGGDGCFLTVGDSYIAMSESAGRGDERVRNSVRLGGRNTAKNILRRARDYSLGLCRAG